MLVHHNPVVAMRRASISRRHHSIVPAVAMQDIQATLWPSVLVCHECCYQANISLLFQTLMVARTSHAEQMHTVWIYLRHLHMLTVHVMLDLKEMQLLDALVGVNRFVLWAMFISLLAIACRLTPCGANAACNGTANGRTCSCNAGYVSSDPVQGCTGLAKV